VVPAAAVAAATIGDSASVTRTLDVSSTKVVPAAAAAAVSAATIGDSASVTRTLDVSMKVVPAAAAVAAVSAATTIGDSAAGAGGSWWLALRRTCWS
jgi:hypothetical protein